MAQLLETLIFVILCALATSLSQKPEHDHSVQHESHGESHFKPDVQHGPHGHPDLGFEHGSHGGSEIGHQNGQHLSPNGNHGNHGGSHNGHQGESHSSQHGNHDNHGGSYENHGSHGNHGGSHDNHGGSHENHGSHGNHGGSHDNHGGSHENHGGSHGNHGGSHENHGGSHENHGGSHGNHGESHNNQGGLEVPYKPDNDHSENSNEERPNVSHEKPNEEYSAENYVEDEFYGSGEQEDTDDNTFDILPIVPLEEQVRVRRQADDNNDSYTPMWVSCDFSVSPRISCYDCNRKLVCKQVGGLVTRCGGQKPYCNAGFCSATPSAGC